MPALSLSDLLNPAVGGDVDIHSQLVYLNDLLSVSGSTSVKVPPHVAQWLTGVISCIELRLKGSPPIEPSSLDSRSPIGSEDLGHPSPCSPTIRENVELNRKTTLSRLYTFEDIHAYVEYPETARDNPIGYLFRQDPNNWQSPWTDFAYSLGHPSGRTKEDEPVICKLLYRGEDKEDLVPCKRYHSTCQGSKVCPKANLSEMRAPHTSATREDIHRRLARDLDHRISSASPNRDIFEKTAAAISAFRKLGCNAPRYEPTILSASEKNHHHRLAEHHSKIRRGYSPESETCEGRLSLEHDKHGNLLVICEHYDARWSRDHYIYYLDGSLDVDYLEAYFNEDDDELSRIEAAAHALGYGPLADCTNVANVSIQRICCPADHRGEDGLLIQPELLRLSCDVKVHYYEPLPDYRESCPYVLVTLKGVHQHPIPLPQKTPPAVRKELLHILGLIHDDLPDLTPRRFLRHPVLKAYLKRRFPDIPVPSLVDLHVSLANRSHINSYIMLIKDKMYPNGTGWEGLCHLKELQDINLPVEQRYIRRTIEISSEDHEAHEEDEELLPQEPKTLRIVICMSKQGSERLLKAQYLQCDTGFKRVMGFQEFELAGMDRTSNISVTYCRVFLTHQTAIAHRRVFEEIEQIVLQDTGQTLKWRHLDSSDLGDTTGMILLVSLDQHGGQAKGIGLHLQTLAQRPAHRDKHDLHEPQRLLSELSPYDHLHRILRLCTVHIYRNIRKCAVPEGVRHLMRGLVCMKHPNWEGALKAIEEGGGKAAADWIQDKVRSKFAFQAICWENSHIPMNIWRAGDTTTNVVESVHSDVNREGLQCTLVGGVTKGQHFDDVKMRSLQATETMGIRPSYLSGHLSENLTRSVKRKSRTHHQKLVGEDKKIETYKKKLKSAETGLEKKQQGLALKQQQVHAFAGPSTSIVNMAYTKALKEQEKAEKAVEKAQKAYDKLLLGRDGLPLGTGKISTA